MRWKTIFRSVKKRVSKARFGIFPVVFWAKTGVLHSGYKLLRNGPL